MIESEVNKVRKELIDLSGGEVRPIGGDKFRARIVDFLLSGSGRIFVPWAAPPSGRTQATSFETATIDWLFGSNGVVDRLSKFFDIETILMPADTYVERNGFDMQNVRQYWQNVGGLITCSTVRTAPTSELENDGLQEYVARAAYTFESLDPQQQAKIAQSAQKYASTTSPAEARESAAVYTMLRAGEARFVDEQLDALWISLNYPERDIMAADVPRAYAPECMRVPWLREGEMA